jgi:hypothetical protein
MVKLNKLNKIIILEKTFGTSSPKSALQNIGIGIGGKETNFSDN